MLSSQCALRALRAHVPTYFTCSRIHVLTCLTCSRTSVPCVPTGVRAITSNNKNNFSIYVLLRFVVLFLSFCCELNCISKLHNNQMLLETTILRIQ